MASLKKIFLMPFFGDLPEWYNKYELPKGYDILLDQDLEGFKQRTKEKLGVEYPGTWGSGKVHDFRCALGYLYSDEIKGYDFWGHTDYDCVYGQVDRWVTDEFLSNLDVHSNHHSYVNGCWSLYRNTEKVNTLFKKYKYWRMKLVYADVNGWVEDEFSRLLEDSGLRYAYTFWQGWPYTQTPNLMKRGELLFQDGENIMMFHFRRSKHFPL